MFFDQYYKGLHVFGADFRLHFDRNGFLSAVNGVFIPNIETDIDPVLTPAAAATIAMEQVKIEFPSAPESYIHTNELMIYRPGLAEGTQRHNYLVYGIEARNDHNVREYIYVDAHRSQIADHYSGMAHALSRRLYENNTGNQIWTEGDAFPGALDIWQQNELVAAEHSYNFFNNAFGWTSYNNADAPMLTVNNDPNIMCPNANWNGTTANYCTGTAADDVVAHEWGHAYTEYTCGLIYQWQAGAMNESLSDIWGETIDLINNYEDAGEDLSLRTACNSSDRWRVGEDATAFGGAIRDMWDPTCNGHPGKVSDPQYKCGEGDNGGVHSNSGVPNHAYALLVDGGNYNGQTIGSIGFVKAAHIFWRVQSLYLTPTSDFFDLADALEAACTDLLGVNLEGLSTTSTPAGPSGEIITTTDCQQITNAILSVELRTVPNCPYRSLFAPLIPLCSGASEANAIFFEDFESGFGAWTVSQLPTNPGTWDSRDWVLDNSLPKNRPGTGAFGADPIVGNCSTDFDNGIIRMESPAISIPATAIGPVQFAFDHSLSMEDSWDGGNIKYSLNGGAWTLLPLAAFTENGYNKTINLASAGNDNPLAGQPGFTAGDEGSFATIWGTSIVDLSTIGAVPGSSIQFRWELGTDGCNGWDGWYIDDVRVYFCTECPEFDPPTANVTAVCSGDTDALTISANVIDCAGGSACACTTANYPATDLPMVIPTTGGIVTSIINVPTAGLIHDVNIINLNGTHSYLSDLNFTLTSPLGTEIFFIGGFCTDMDNFNFSLDDSATTTLPCPPTSGGTHYSGQHLANFNGEDAAGNWVLTITDFYNGDGGSLDGWALEICTVPACPLSDVTLTWTVDGMAQAPVSQSCGNITQNFTLTHGGDPCLIDMQTISYTATCNDQPGITVSSGSFDIAVSPPVQAPTIMADDADCNYSVMFACPLLDAEGAGTSVNGSTEAPGYAGGTVPLEVTNGVCTTTFPAINKPACTTPNGMASILDPCVCKDNESAPNAGDGQFDEIVQVEGGRAETWYIVSVSEAGGGNVGGGLYDPASAPPPATPTNFTIGAGGVTLVNGVSDGLDNDNDTMIDEADEETYYTLQGIHTDELGYAITLTNGATSLSISNNCYYPTINNTINSSYCSNVADFDMTPLVSGLLGSNAAATTGTFSFDVLDAGNASASTSTILSPATLGVGSFTIVITFDETDAPGTIDPGCITTISTPLTITNCCAADNGSLMNNN